jgi:hypothetical protein
MRMPSPNEFDSFEHQATRAKWRRGVFVFYGCATLILIFLVAWVAAQSGPDAVSAVAGP